MAFSHLLPYFRCEKPVDHIQSPTCLPDRQKIGQLAQVVGLIFLEPTFQKAADVGIAYYAECRTDHELQPKVSGMSIRIAFLYPSHGYARVLTLQKSH